MADLVLEVLNKSNIDVINWRGQSYDNVSNIIGTYKGMQAEIRSGITLIVKSVHLWRNIFYSNAVNHPEKGKLFKLWLKHKTMHKSSLGHKDQT